MLAKIIAPLLAAAVLLLVPGCGENVTLEAYEQIENGMDLVQVEDIMGGPGELQTAAGVGIGAGGLPEIQDDSGEAQSYLWGDESVGIVVKFKDGKVYYKQKMGL